MPDGVQPAQALTTGVENASLHRYCASIVVCSTEPEAA
jgi:hypothetical protein